MASVESIMMSFLHNAHLSLCRVMMMLSTPLLPITIGMDSLAIVGMAALEKMK